MTRLSLVAAALFTLSGCTIWYALNGDPSDIPCDEVGECLEGFVCVPAEPVPLCRRAAIGDEGSPCAVDGECNDGLVCGDVFGDDPGLCGAGSEADPNCIVASGEGLRCRRSCESAACAAGDLCFSDKTGRSFCQAAPCREDADCGANPLSGNANICDLFAENAGICLSQCDPFSCTNPGITCGECPALDADNDGTPDVWGCIAVPFANQIISGRFGCQPVGDIPAGETCGLPSDCRTGSFCTTLLNGGQQGLCSQYCAEAGNPACDVGSCTGQLDGDVRFCQ